MARTMARSRYTRTKNILKINKEVGMLLPKKESGVGKSRKSSNYYEDIHIPPYNTH